LVANVTPGNNPTKRVDFFAGSTLLGSAMNAPYKVTWANAAAGNYTLTAVAVDTADNQSPSSGVSIQIASAPSVTVDPGIANSSVNDNRITVRGTSVLPPNGSIVVNNVLANVDRQGNWFADNVPLDAGANTLSVTALTLDYASVETS